MNITKKDVTEMIMTEKGLWDNIHAKKERGESPAKPGNKDYPEKKAWNKAKKESVDKFTNQNIFALIDEIVMMETGEPIIEDLVITNEKLCEGIITPSILENIVNEALYEYYGMTERNLNEAEYHGKKVSLGKISRGDVKKYKVYVKNGQGHVVKVNFGDPNMEIKRDNPKRRKSFRARHHCENPGPRWKARYWSCKAW
jgi:hypothetical protein